MFFRIKKKHIYLLIFLIIVIINLIFPSSTNKKPLKSDLTNNRQLTTDNPLATSSSELALVKRVIDGDTIELESGQKVRYIGIDTPELHNPKNNIQCFGEEAKSINQKLVEGKIIRLEKDVSETDQYNRLLRYVFLPDTNNASSSGLFINQFLIEEGYALIATFPPDIKYAEFFRKKQKLAKDKNIGLWKQCLK